MVILLLSQYNASNLPPPPAALSSIPIFVTAFSCFPPRCTVINKIVHFTRKIHAPTGDVTKQLHHSTVTMINEVKAWDHTALDRPVATYIVI